MEINNAKIAALQAIVAREEALITELKQKLGLTVAGA